MIAAAILLSVGSGVVLRHAEYRKFQENFEANAEKVIDFVQITIRRKMESLDTLSASFTAFATATGAVWPNVTLPDYAVRAAGIRALAGAPNINTYHLVTDETRQGWEAYVRENQQKLYDAGTASEIYQRSRQDAIFMQPKTHFPEAPITPVNDKIVDLHSDGSVSDAPEGSGKVIESSLDVPESRPSRNILRRVACFACYSLPERYQL